MTPPGFQLHERLARDTVPLGDFPLSRLLLMNDSRYPWCILVPRRPAISEIHHLETAAQMRLQAESCFLSRQMACCFSAHKMNIAALGNQVPQLHLHHIARQREDAAWPHPVWGRLPPLPYAADELAALKARLLPLLAEDETFVAAA